jgi:hypothetical protein
LNRAKAIFTHAGALYQAVADAGLAATAAQLLESSGWGLTDGKPSIQACARSFPEHTGNS